MNITAIRQQVKRADRYSVYVDGKYICSFSESELLNLGLRIGQQFSEAELEALKHSALQDKAYDRALNLLARRPRSQWELESYLKRKEYPPEIIQPTLDHLQERGYINDLDFARRWISNRRLLKPTSRRKLVQELRQKHLSSIVIEEALAADPTDELETLRALIERKRTHYPDQLKLMQYLARQGFSYDDIKSVLNEDEDS